MLHRLPKVDAPPVYPMMKYSCCFFLTSTLNENNSASASYVVHLVPGVAWLGQLFQAVVSGRVGHCRAMELLTSWWLPLACGAAAALPDPTSQYTPHRGLWWPQNGCQGQRVIA